MRKRCLYNVYERGSLVGERLMQQEIFEKFNIQPNTQIHKYASSGIIYNRRYTFKLVGETQTKDHLVKKFPEDLLDEWKAVCEIFQKVEWVKQGGRRLHVR